MAATHKALIYKTQGGTPVVEDLPTPTPGHDEVLVSTKAIALNPLDGYMRDFGAFVGQWPAVAGSDMAGTIESVGTWSSTPASKHNSEVLVPGTRVTVRAEAFSKLADPPYGGFQEKVLVHAANVAPIPDSLSFADAAIIPISIWTTWLAMSVIGISTDTKHSPSDKKGFLVWGASGSLGSAGVQIAKSLGYQVYAAASAKHHEYLKTLGATFLVDYNDPATAVEQLVSAAKSDGITIKEAYHAAMGDLKPTLDVLAAFGGGKVADAIPPNETTPHAENVECNFVKPPESDEEQKAIFQWIYNQWLPKALVDGTYKPSPKTRIEGHGLESINDAVNTLQKGVSGEKFVIEL